MSFKWYVLAVRSNYEEKIKKGLEEKIAESEMSGSFGEVLVPAKIVVDRDGKEKKMNHYRGYVFIEMDLNNTTWSLVKEMRGASELIGADKKPIPVPQREIDEIKKFLDSSVADVAANEFSVGDEVSIIDGPFNSFNGVVTNVNQAKEELAIDVVIFGRPTQVTLGFRAVEK